jgi:glycerophosphoryl diester phosphodiesterase
MSSPYHIIAHRGASAYAPENTLSAFKCVKSYNTHWIECDVTLTRDGIPIIFHDKTLKRQTGLSHQINQVDFAFTQSLDVGRWFSEAFIGERIPTLEALLSYALSENILINLEIKSHGYQPKWLVKKIREAIQRINYPAKTNMIISSFEKMSLLYAQHLVPQVRRGLLLSKWDKAWFLSAERLRIYSVHCDYKILTPKRITSILEKGYKLYVYTVNNRAIAQCLFDHHVDGIFSDYPDLME